MSHCTARLAPPPDTPQSFLEFFRFLFTAQLCKQIQALFRPYQGSRWQPQPLLFVLLSMTWCCGDSPAERFETAKAFYVACYQGKKRPGKTLQGFHKALARLPVSILRAVAGLVRQRLARVFAEHLRVDGFVPLGCDGSRLNCPRTKQLQKRLTNKRKVPQLWVTAIVHLSLGLLWSWRLGRGNKTGERAHLRQLLPTLPKDTLLVTDAGYPGYHLMQTLIDKNIAFLMRLSCTAPLYAPQRLVMARFREGLVYYWPQEAQEKKQPPLQVRLVRLGEKKASVWLITNVLDEAKLSRKTVSKFYRWRWRNEGFFRTYKRTLGKVKLQSRTVALVHREAEGSLLAVQVLLAQASLASLWGGEGKVVVVSGRNALLAVRVEIRDVTGMYLGPRQKRTYTQRLAEAQARRDRRRRRRHKQKVRVRWRTRKEHRPPKAPKIRRMGTDLKQLLKEALNAA